MEEVVVEEVEIKGLVALGTHLGRGRGVMEGCLPLEESASKLFRKFLRGYKEWRGLLEVSVWKG